MGNWPFALVIGGSLLLGYVVAEVYIRVCNKRLRRERLIAEFMDKQLWQFISLDEWLKKNQTRLLRK